MSDVRSYQANVSGCDRAIDVHVFAEVTGGHRQADLTSRLPDVGVVDRFVSVGIADEHALIAVSGNTAKCRWSHCAKSP